MTEQSHHKLIFVAILDVGCSFFMKLLAININFCFKASEHLQGFCLHLRGEILDQYFDKLKELRTKWGQKNSEHACGMLMMSCVN